MIANDGISRQRRLADTLRWLREERFGSEAEIRLHAMSSDEDIRVHARRALISNQWRTWRKLCRIVWVPATPDHELEEWSREF